MDSQNNTKEVIVTAAGSGKFKQQITSGSHQFIVDEPIAVGGDDEGPSPYDLILAALGSCTSMTLSLYAKLKKIPLEKVTVRLTHAKVHATDCTDCENKNAKIDQIERKVTLEGDLSDEQRKTLLSIANKCPVHQTLSAKINILTALT